MFGEQLGGVFSSVSLSERWRLIISYLTEQWIAASLLALLCQVNVPFFKWWRAEGGGEGCIVDSEMMITHLTLCCCLPTAETSERSREISLNDMIPLNKTGCLVQFFQWMSKLQNSWLWSNLDAANAYRWMHREVQREGMPVIYLQCGPMEALLLAQAGKLGKSVLGAWSAEARTRGFFPMNWSQVPALKVKGRGAGEVI